MTIRETRQGDLKGLLELYAHLQKEGRLEPDLEAERVWRRILREENHHILVAEEGGRILSSCVCVVVPNLTHGQRPYALVENVVTHPDFRERGLGQRLPCRRAGAGRAPGLLQDHADDRLEKGEHAAPLRKGRLQPAGQDGPLFQWL